MMDEASINKWGQKVIPFDDYVLSEIKQRHIIKKVLIDYKVPKYLRYAFNTTITLGCSPRYTPKVAPDDPLYGPDWHPSLNKN